MHRYLYRLNLRMVSVSLRFINRQLMELQNMKRATRIRSIRYGDTCGPNESIGSNVYGEI